MCEALGLIPAEEGRDRAGKFQTHLLLEWIILLKDRKCFYLINFFFVFWIVIL
jgi:hypothetical protein